MGEVVPFAFGESLVRVVTRDGQPWFVAVDVCRVLGIRDAHDAVKGLDEDEKGTDVIRTPGGDQQLLIVSESGLYALILRSRKQAARKFRKWVTSEVLPTIRKTGRYEAPAELANTKTVEEFLSRHDLRVLAVCRAIAAEGRSKVYLGELAERAGLSRANTRRAYDLLRIAGLVEEPPRDELVRGQTLALPEAS